MLDLALLVPARTEETMAELVKLHDVGKSRLCFLVCLFFVVAFFFCKGVLPGYWLKEKIPGLF